MTTKKELLQKIAELQAKIDEMPDEFRIETVRAYEPLEIGQRYCVAYPAGDFVRPVWNNDSADMGQLNAGQVFLSKEAAEREAKRKHLWHQCRKAMKEAWEAFGEAPDWRNFNEQDKHGLFINAYEVKKELCWVGYAPIHFPTEESLCSWRSTVTDDDILLMLIEEW